MLEFLKRLLCKHDYKFFCNIYGDDIIRLGGKRSMSRCPKCGDYKLFDKLQTEECKMGKFYDAYEEMKNRGKDVGSYTSSDQDKMNQGVKIPLKTAGYPVDNKPNNIKRFELLGAEKALLYARKNADYGDSFNKSLDEDGLLVAKIRLGDKYLRFCQLINNPAQVTEEKLRETLIDLSNYADMTIMWLDDKEELDNKKMKEMGMFAPVPPVLSPKTPKHNDELDAMGYAIKHMYHINAGADLDGDIVHEGIKTSNPNLVDLNDGNTYNIHIHADASMTPEKITSLVNESMKRIGVRDFE
jgi:hypothetical protein